MQELSIGVIPLGRCIAVLVLIKLVLCWSLGATAQPLLAREGHAAV